MSQADLASVLRTRVGLVLGPGVIYHTGVLGALAAQLSDVFDSRVLDTYLAVGDLALAGGASPEQLSQQLALFFKEQDQSPFVSELARVKWSAVLSACVDDVFDRTFVEEGAVHRLRQPVTVASDLRQPVPPRTTPIYKLLGSLSHDDAAICSADLYRRSAQWPLVCRAFVDRLQGAPVVCLGMSSCAWVFWQLLGVLTSEPATCPSSIILLDDDPLARDPTVHRIVSRRLRLFSVTANLGGLLSAVTDAEARVIQEQLPFPARGSEELAGALHPFRELVTLVNAQTEGGRGAHEVHQLRALLFEPSTPRWDAFVHNLDFERDLTRDAVSDLELLAKSQTPGSCAGIVRGLTACGKTTVLKRIALDLARKGVIVLWLRPWFYQDTQPVLLELFRKLRTSLPETTKRVVVFLDDPLTFGSLTSQDVVRAAESAHVEIVLVATARTVDWETRDEREFIGRLQRMADIDVPAELTGNEVSRLPAYLVKLGVAADLEAAKQMVRSLPTSAAGDVLATLYWSLSETRKIIRQSIRDEYFRLGDSAALTKVVIGAMESTTELLQKAYGLIAVAEKYRNPVPIEVLVASLGVRYDEWLDATGSGTTAWGLFYADFSDDNQTVTYRTRNAVVTEIIVRTINGGELSHAGEFFALKTLLAACSGSAPTYREFCLRILLSSSLDELEYSEGLELFDVALRALPHPDRTLVHHKGLWIKDRGDDVSGAMRVLNEALTTSNYPYAAHAEADEHIYTSLAATSLKGMKNGELGLDEGRRLVLRYLDKAQSPGFFNPNATHVEARLIRDLIDQAAPDDPDRVALVVRALRSIDAALLMLRARGAEPVTRLGDADDMAMLEGAKRDLLTRVASVDDVRAQADAMWNAHGRQDGFVLTARMLYAGAQSSGKGTDFFRAAEYCESILEKLRAAGVPPLNAFLEAAIDVLYEWRVVRQVRVATGEEVDWARLKSLTSEVLKGAKRGSDPFREYIHALALAHLGDWAQANAMFAALRNAGLPGAVLWARRDRYLAKNGRPLRVQGTVRELADRRYLYVEELKTDFKADRNDPWPRANETAHAFIEFSFGGSTAVRDR